MGVCIIYRQVLFIYHHIYVCIHTTTHSTTQFKQYRDQQSFVLYINHVLPRTVAQLDLGGFRIA